MVTDVRSRWRAKSTVVVTPEASSVTPQLVDLKIAAITLGGRNPEATKDANMSDWRHRKTDGTSASTTLEKLKISQIVTDWIGSGAELVGEGVEGAGVVGDGVVGDGVVGDGVVGDGVVGDGVVGV